MFFFFFNDTAPTEIYPLSLHAALPIFRLHDFRQEPRLDLVHAVRGGHHRPQRGPGRGGRSEEHTSELQSHLNLVCRLLLEKKKKHNVQIRAKNDLGLPYASQTLLYTCT